MSTIFTLCVFTFLNKTEFSSIENDNKGFNCICVNNNLSFRLTDYVIYVVSDINGFSFSGLIKEIRTNFVSIKKING